MVFRDNCGVPGGNQPCSPPPQPPAIQGHHAAPDGGFANTAIRGIPLYTVFGVCGVALQLLSLVIPFSRIFIRYHPVIYDLLTQQNDLMVLVIIGIGGSITGLLFQSWKQQVLSGIIFLILPMVYVYSWWAYQLSWFVVAFLGGIFLVIGGLLLRTAASYVTDP